MALGVAVGVADGVAVGVTPGVTVAGTKVVGVAAGAVESGVAVVLTVTVPAAVGDDWGAVVAESAVLGVIVRVTIGADGPADRPTSLKRRRALERMRTINPPMSRGSNALPLRCATGFTPLARFGSVCLSTYAPVARTQPQQTAWRSVLSQPGASRTSAAVKRTLTV